MSTSKRSRLSILDSLGTVVTVVGVLCVLAGAVLLLMALAATEAGTASLVSFTMALSSVVSGIVITALGQGFKALAAIEEHVRANKRATLELLEQRQTGSTGVPDSAPEPPEPTPHEPDKSSADDEGSLWKYHRRPRQHKQAKGDAPWKCHCGTTVDKDRETCPECGRSLNATT